MRQTGVDQSASKVTGCSIGSHGLSAEPGIESVGSGFAEPDYAQGGASDKDRAAVYSPGLTV